MRPPSAYERRRAAQAAAKARAHLRPVADEEAVEKLLTEVGNANAHAGEASVEDAPLDVPVSAAEVDAALAGLRRAVEERRLEALLVASRRSVIDAIVRPFGIGALVARFDRRGGPVLTLHNADEAVKNGWSADEFAEPDRLRAFRERVEEPYRRGDYEAEDWADRKDAAWERSGGRDAYTDKTVVRERGADVPQGEVDHVIPLAEVHRDRRAAFHLTRDQEVELANSDENLVVTEGGLNSSKNAEALEDWMDKPATDGSGTNADRYRVDRERAAKVDRRAREHREQVVDEAALKRYAEAAVGAAATEAVRVGLYQALGLVLVELAEALYDETVRFLSASADGTKLFERLGEALRRVAERVVGQWRAGLEAFGHGAVSGILSALVTITINFFYTTAKRVVRILREGVLSAGRALRTLLFPPPGLSGAEAAHEASKLLAGALAVSGGIAVEEAVEKALIAVPILVPVASPLTTVIVGLGTGLATVVLCYLLDQADTFGVRRQAEAASIGAVLDDEIGRLVATLEEGLNEAGAPA